MKDIIELACKAGFNREDHHAIRAMLTRFAALVRAAALEEAAEVCDGYDGSWYVHRKGAAECAAAIRIRALKEMK